MFISKGGRYRRRVSNCGVFLLFVRDEGPASDLIFSSRRGAAASLWKSVSEKPDRAEKNKHSSFEELELEADESSGVRGISNSGGLDDMEKC